MKYSKLSLATCVITFRTDSLLHFYFTFCDTFASGRVLTYSVVLS